MMTLWLARHGITDWNLEKRYQGQTDIPLNAIGQRQAEQLAHFLSDENIHTIISSDLQRAATTAGIIAAFHSLDIELDACWREAHFGLFEGLSYRDIMQQHPAIAQTWFDDPEKPPPGGEKLSDVASRVAMGWHRIMPDYTDHNLLIMAHAGTLSLLLCQLFDLPPTEYWRFSIAPGALSQVHIYSNRAILMKFNLDHFLVERQ